MNGNPLYKILSYVWRNTLLKWYRGHKQKKEDRYWEEHRKSFGRENPDKTFYVIRRRDLYCGLFSLFITNLKRIDDALKMGYIPVVDMQSSYNIYLENELVGKENSWEYYFEQPCGYQLKEVYRSKNVIVGDGKVPKMFPYLDIDFLLGRTGELHYWREKVRENIRLKKETREIIERKYEELFRTGEKVLGVICRGTDYVQGKPRNHPVQPTAEQSILQSEKIMSEYGCSKLFLATEDSGTYQKFLDRFADKLITNKTSYIDYKGGAIGKEESEQVQSRRANGLEYLTTVMLLAKCDCLCAGCVSATVGALLLTEGYEYTYLFDLGIYE